MFVHAVDIIILWKSTQFRRLGVLALLANKKNADIKGCITQGDAGTDTFNCLCPHLYIFVEILTNHNLSFCPFSTTV